MEVFAVAANAMAAVSLALQLIDTIESLRDLWKGMKNAPAEVEHIISELELLQEVLDGMQKALQLRCESGPDPVQVSSVLTALRQCQRHITQMAGFTSNLCDGLAERRLFARFKIVQRKSKIAEFSRSLEQAKTTLLLAVNVATFMLEEECSKKVLQQFAHLRSDIEIKFHIHSDHQMASKTASEDGETSCPSQKINTTDRQLSASDILLWLLQLPPDSPYREKLHQTGRLIGRVSWRSFRKQASDTAAQERCKTVSIHLPILGRSFAIESRWALGQWTHTFRVTRIVPDSAPIFRVCATREDTFIHEVFKSGLASPFDQTISGISLLHVAAASYRYETYKLLRSYGVEYSFCEHPKHGKLAPIEFTQDYIIFAEGQVQTVQAWLGISNEEATIMSPESNYQNAVGIWNSTLEIHERISDEEIMTLLQGPLRLPRDQQAATPDIGVEPAMVKPRFSRALLLFCYYFLFHQDPYGHEITSAWLHSSLLPGFRPVPLWDYLGRFWHRDKWLQMLSQCNGMDFRELSQRQQDRFTGISYSDSWNYERGKWVKKKKALFKFGGDGDEAGVWIGPLAECEAVFEFEVLDDGDILQRELEVGEELASDSSIDIAKTGGLSPECFRNETMGAASKDGEVAWLMICAILFCFLYF